VVFGCFVERRGIEKWDGEEGPKKKRFYYWTIKKVVSKIGNDSPTKKKKGEGRDEKKRLKNRSFEKKNVI